MRLIDSTHYGSHVLRLAVDEAPHMASSCHQKSKICIQQVIVNLFRKKIKLEEAEKEYTKTTRLSGSL